MTDQEVAQVASECGLSVEVVRHVASTIARIEAPGLTVVKADLDAEFDRIWPHYPRHVGTGAARSKWKAARKRASFDEIAKPLWQFILAIRGTPKDKIPHFATWLHQERWKDDQTHAANRQRTSDDDLEHLSRIPSSDDDLLRLMGPR